MYRIVVTLALLLLLVASQAGCGPQRPEAQFNSTPTTGQVPVEVQFTDLSQGNISAWEWDFDHDGVVDSSLQNPKYVYSDPGNYTVSLMVSGPSGNDTEVKADYLVLTPPSCRPDFVAELTTIRGIRPIKFTDKSTGNVIAWAWDFDSDGTIESTEQNPTCTYTKNGVYSVTLTIITPDCTHTLTKSDYIRVSGCSG